MDCFVIFCPLYLLVHGKIIRQIKNSIIPCKKPVSGHTGAGVRFQAPQAARCEFRSLFPANTYYKGDTMNNLRLGGLSVQYTWESWNKIEVPDEKNIYPNQ